MSFSGGGGGGFAGSEETLAYMIKAFDLATPVFRSFGAAVAETTKQVQASVAEMNRAIGAQDKVVATSAEEQIAAQKRIQAAYTATGARGVELARMQADLAKKGAVASKEQVAATNKVAAATERTAAVSTAAHDRQVASLQRAGKIVLATAVGAAAGSLDLATKFQANTLRMETQAGATAKGLDQIRQGLLKMAGEVGATPDQLANGMYHVVSSMNAVLPPATRVTQELQIMKVAAEGAQIGHSNLEETTYALSAAMNALHQNASMAKMTMGELNSIVGSGDMTMQDLVNALKSGLIPAAASFGMSLQSVGAALSVMGDMGMRGALAGTRLRMAISLLGAPTQEAAKILETLGLSAKQSISQSYAMADALKKAGVSATQISYDLKQPDGLQVALQDLDSHLRQAGLSATGAGDVISRAFGGGRMGSAIMLMAENTDRLKLKFNQIGEGAGQFGHDWELTAKTFRVELDKALASVEALGIGLGEKLLPYATTALHDLEDMANWLAKNKVALDILGAAVVSFSTIAVGAFLIKKLEQAANLLKGFGTGAAGMGRWMMGGGPMPFGGGPETKSPLTQAQLEQSLVRGNGPAPGPLGALGGSVTGGIWGINATQIRVGTLMNPLAVRMVGAGFGGGTTAEQTAATAGVSAPAATAEEKALQSELRKMEGAVGATAMGGSALKGPFTAPGVKGFITRDQYQQMVLGPQMAHAEEQRLFAESRGTIPLGMGNPLMTSGPISAQGERQLSLGTVGTGAGMAPTLRAEERAIQQKLAQEAKRAETSLLTRVKGSLGSTAEGLMRGAGVAGLGVMGAQMAGSMVGGKPGSAISSIGSMAAMGAGIGTAIEPGIGTAIGGALGGVAGAIEHFLGSRSFGQSRADQLAGPGHANYSQQTRTDLAKQIDTMAGIVHPGEQVVGRPRPGSRDGAPVMQEITLDVKSLNPDQLAKYMTAAKKAGSDISGKLQEGWNQYKFQSEPIMFTQLRSSLKGMPHAVQAYSIQSAIAFTSTLEKHGRVAKGAADSMLAQAEIAFPEFTKYLGLQGKAGMEEFTKALDLSHTQDKLKTQLNSMRGDFPEITKAMDTTSGDVLTKSEAVVKALKGIAEHGTGPASAKAKADIKAIKATVNTDLTQAAISADTQAKAMAKSIQKGSGSSAQTAETNFARVVKAVQGAMASGATTVDQGEKIITQALNAMLKAFGSKPVNIVGLTAGQLSTFNPQTYLGGSSTTGGATAGGHATGGMMVNHPMYVVGEEAPAHPEYVLATNPAYRERNKHLWAKAGQDLGIPGFKYGGYIDPIPGFSLNRTDMGVDASAAPGTPILAFGPSKMVGYQSNWYHNQPLMDFQLTGGPDAGRYWYVAEQIVPLAHMGQNIPQGGIVARFASQGTGIEIGWAADAAGTTLAQATTGYHEGQVTPAGQSFRSLITGSPQGKGFAIPAFKPIAAPKVKGSGLVAQATQAALNMATAAANAKAQAVIGSAGSTAGGIPFSGGGGSWLATAYGPPWGGIEGGGTTATGIDLHGSPHEYIIATDPSVIPMHSKVKVWPNPFNYRGFFQAEDTGGAIKGHHIDIYDWLGRANQNAWGARNVSVSGRAQGGMLDYAGAFGQGGAFTANRPTLAMFGDNGPETVMAVPHYASGGVYGSTSLGLPDSSMPPNQVTNTSSGGGTTNSTTYTSTPVIQGDSLVTSTTTISVNTKGQETVHTHRSVRPLKSKTVHYTTAFNPMTDSIESHTATEWQTIHAHYSKQRHDAAAAKKAYDAWLAQSVKDMLVIGGLPAGVIDLTRRQAKKEGLPTGGRSVSLTGSLKHMTDAGFKRVESGLKSYLGITSTDDIVTLLLKDLPKGRGVSQTSRRGQIVDTIATALSKAVGSEFHSHQNQFQSHDQIMQLIEKAPAGTTAASLGFTGAQLKALHLTRGMIKRLAGTESGPAAFQQQINELSNQVIPEYKKDARSLTVAYKASLKTHNKKLQAALLAQLNAVSQAEAQAIADKQAAQVSLVDSVYQAGQNRAGAFQGGADMIKAVASLPTGTDIASLGLSGAALNTMGLGWAGSNLNNLAGNANPMGAAWASNAMLSAERSANVDTLNGLVAQLPSLKGSALDQANQHIQDLSKSIASLTQEINTNLMDAIKAVAQNFQDTADQAKASTDILSTIGDLKPGTDLSSIGLTSGLLSALGIDPSIAAAIEGGGPSYISNLQSQQNGVLTPQQIESARSYYNTVNTGIQSQIGSLAGEMGYDLSQLPGLTGSNRTSMLSSIDSLAGQIASLEGTIQSNNEAVSKLTNTINKASTTSTGQLTGTVAYSYQNQGFTASLNSETPLNLGVGS